MRNLFIAVTIATLGLLAPGCALAQCPTTNSSPAFTSGGSVFGRLYSQWNTYFSSKVDANNGILCNPTIIGGPPAGTFTAGPGLTNAQGTRNIGNNIIAPGGMEWTQLWPVLKPSSYTVNGDAGGTSDSGATLIASGSSVIFTAPNPGASTKGVKYSFGSDGTHGYTLTTIGHTAIFYGCVGGGSASLTVAANTAVLIVDDGTNYNCAGTPPAITGIPVVASAADLQGLPSTLTPTIQMVGYYSRGDGMPPFNLNSSNSPCSLYGGNGDGVSQFKSSDNKCWISAFESSIDWRQGGVSTASSENHTAIQMTLDAGFRAGLPVYFCGVDEFLSSSGLFFYPSKVEWCSSQTVLKQTSPGVMARLVNAIGNTFPTDAMHGAKLVRPTIDMNQSAWASQGGGAGIVMTAVDGWDIEDPLIYNPPTRFTPAPSTSTVTISIASPAVTTWVNHGLAAGQYVVYSSTGTLPTNILPGVTYYVLAAGLTTNSFEISTAPGGSPVNTTGSQGGVQTAGIGAAPGNFPYCDSRGCGWAPNGTIVLLGSAEANVQGGHISRGLGGGVLTPVTSIVNCDNVRGAAGLVLGMPMPMSALTGASHNPANNNTYDDALFDCNSFGVRDDYGIAKFTDVDTTWSTLAGVTLGRYGMAEYQISGGGGNLGITLMSDKIAGSPATASDMTVTDAITKATNIAHSITTTSAFANQNISAGVYPGSAVLHVDYGGEYSSPATTTGTTSVGKAVVTSVAGFAGIAVGQEVVGAGIPPYATVRSINTGASTLTMSQAATSFQPGDTLTFYGDQPLNIAGCASNTFPACNSTMTPTGNTHSSSTTIDGISSMAGLAAANNSGTQQAITGTGIPANTTIVSVNVAGSSITISNPATSSNTGATLTVTGNLEIQPFFPIAWSELDFSSAEITGTSISVGAGVQNWQLNNPQQVTNSIPFVTANHSGPLGANGPQIISNRGPNAVSWGTPVTGTLTTNCESDPQPYLVTGALTVTLGPTEPRGLKCKFINTDGLAMSNPLTINPPPAAWGNYTVQGQASLTSYLNWGAIELNLDAVNNNTGMAPVNNSGGNWVGAPGFPVPYTPTDVSGAVSLPFTANASNYLQTGNQLIANVSVTYGVTTGFTQNAAISLPGPCAKGGASPALATGGGGAFFARQTGTNAVNILKSDSSNAQNQDLSGKTLTFTTSCSMQ